MSGGGRIAKGSKFRQVRPEISAIRPDEYTRQKPVSVSASGLLVLDSFSLQVWDLRTGTKLHSPLRLRTACVTDLHFSRDGQGIVTVWYET